MRISPIRTSVCKTNFKADYKRKENNVVIMGSSRYSENTINDLVRASEVARVLLAKGKNIITGGCTRGIVGQVYYTVADFSERDKDGKPEQNLIITREPFMGDEDFDNCKIIAHAQSEAERIEKFEAYSNSFVVFPGGPATMQEAATLISENHHAKNKKQIFLVGTEYFKDLDNQYQIMYESGLLDCAPSELYTLTDDPYKVGEEID